MIKDFINWKITSEKDCIKKWIGKCWCCENTEVFFDMISDNFNSFEEFKWDGVCKECLPLFNADYRKKSFYITDKEAKTIKQNEIFNILHNIKLPCIISFTDSNKKHRLFRSKISTEKENVCIILDDWYLFLNLEKDIKILDKIDEFYKKNKVSKEWIIEGTYPVGAIKKYDLSEFLELEKLVKPLRGGQKLKYLVAFCNKE